MSGKGSRTVVHGVCVQFWSTLSIYVRRYKQTLHETIVCEVRLVLDYTGLRPGMAAKPVGVPKQRSIEIWSVRGTR